LFTRYPFWFNLGNTAIISVLSTIAVILVAMPAAYSFARWNTGGGHLLFVTISTRMFPGVVAAIPFFIVFRALGLLDTHAGLISLYVYFNTVVCHVFAVWLFQGSPGGTGASGDDRRLRANGNLPQGYLSADFAGVAVTSVFCLIWSWNEFFYAFLFTRRAARTVNVLISSFWGSIEVQYGPMGGRCGDSDPADPASPPGSCSVNHPGVDVRSGKGLMQGRAIETAGARAAKQTHAMNR